MDNKEATIGKVLEILRRSFDIIDKCYQQNDEAAQYDADYSETGSRIIFPCYNRHSRGAKRRFSEQELRFVFLEQFNQYCNDSKTAWDVYYSVETPTEWKYKFAGEDKPRKTGDDTGESASFDVCIHDKTGKRICMIEFKAGNPEPSHLVKDFVKQSNEVAFEKGQTTPLPAEDTIQFFVQLLERQNRSTEGNIHEKIREYLTKNYDSGEIEKMKRIIYVCHTVEKAYKGTKCTWFGEGMPSKWGKENLWEEINV